VVSQGHPSTSGWSLGIGSLSDLGRGRSKLTLELLNVSFGELQIDFDIIQLDFF